jgi:hypothetical protein
MKTKLFALIAFCVALASHLQADTLIYDDGMWRVTGLESTNLLQRRVTVSVDAVPAGEFAELLVQRNFAGGFPAVCAILAKGGVQLTVPPTGVFGGAFYLTRYSDCYLGQQLDTGFVTLNIQSNTKNTKSLRFTGTLSNFTSLQSTDLSMKLDLPNNSTVRMDVRYHLDATTSVCVDQWAQQIGEGFQVVRMASNFIADNWMFNDGFRMKGFLGPYCDCCGCYYQKGSLCGFFANTTGYVLPYFAWMANSKLQMLHWQIGPFNTPALRVSLKSPSRSKSSVQGYTVFSTDPAAENVDLWINWSKASLQYPPGSRVAYCRFKLEAVLPAVENCDLIVP